MSELDEVFKALRGVMSPYASVLDCVVDTNDHLSLNTRYIQKNNKPLFFGAVQINKNYVSYHLMPVYVQPDLLASLSPELKRRMHGKSCFNFTSVEPQLVQELARLTEAGLQKYKDAGYI